MTIIYGALKTHSLHKFSFGAETSLNNLVSFRHRSPALFKASLLELYQQVYVNTS